MDDSRPCVKGITRICARVRPRRCGLLALAIASSLGSAALAQTSQSPVLLDPIPDARPDVPRVVLDASLRSRTLKSVTITPESIRGREAGGKSVVIPRSEVLAIIPSLRPLGSVDASITQASAMLRLTDGQALPGVPSSALADEAEAVAWESSLLGPVQVPLDRLSMMILRPEARGVDRLRATSSDMVLLLNGDMLDGYLERVGPTITMEKDRKRSEIDRSRVVGIAFANPPTPASGAWAWFFDGSTIAADRLEISVDGRVRLTPALSGAPTISRDANDVRAVLFDAARIRGLADAPWTLMPQTPARRWSPPPIVGEARHAALFAADIEFPGPMGVEWSLPDRSVRFAMTAEMPPAARVWGDLDLVVGIAGNELGRYHLNASNPTADINVSLGDSVPPGARLSISVEAGPSGPIQDRVVLRRPMILLAK
ncbi:hypothetical protein PHYC_02555 [Phycisphaerales bacterium]|nr:hypothetical protein PHYC_02555 [Phycisphaerales bacterium]